MSHGKGLKSQHFEETSFVKWARDSELVLPLRWLTRDSYRRPQIARPRTRITAPAKQTISVTNNSRTLVNSVKVDHVYDSRLLWPDAGIDSCNCSNHLLRRRCLVNETKKCQIGCGNVLSTFDARVITSKVYWFEKNVAVIQIYFWILLLMNDKGFVVNHLCNFR